MRNTLLAIVLALVSLSVFAQNTAWYYSTNTDISGKVTETAISWNLIVRCSKECEVYFIPDRYTLVDDQQSVLVKFNDKPVKRYGVFRSDDYTALFFSDPMGILKAIRDNGGYMIVEYKPYQKTPDMVKYEVWNLPPTILTRIATGEKQQRMPQAKKKTTPQEKREAACKDDYASDPFTKSPNCDYPELDPNHKADAHSYQTKESRESHAFFWIEQETDTQARGCWAKKK